VEHHEALQTSAVVGQLADAVQGEVDDLLACGEECESGRRGKWGEASQGRIKLGRLSHSQSLTISTLTKSTSVTSTLVTSTNKKRVVIGGSGE
jgi:hypothetical protein